MRAIATWSQIPKDAAARRTTTTMPVPCSELGAPLLGSSVARRDARRPSAFAQPLVLALAVALGCAGCRATRELAIDSKPPGAEVRVDDILVGTTPMRLPFKDYGTRRITLYKPGYLTNSQLVEVEAPWYATFPIDLFTEVLFPVGWHHVQHFESELVPGTGSIATPDLEEVLARAEVLRRAGPEGPKREPTELTDTLPPPAASPAKPRVTPPDSTSK